MDDERINEEQQEDINPENDGMNNDADNEADNDELAPDNGYKPTNRFDAAAVHHLSGMYQNWFLDYASYVILERAVPHIEDGLKPVQRRILHSMKRMDDGRYNKVANIVGHTMQFHPHGDASIGDALVQMGQKDLLIDTQGNWGNILTGDRAAAPRYIEARLSKFALDTVFNPKTTEWQMSYDGRNKEPITLPVKFPLLLAQGAEGIAVGLLSKILPHNFIELCDAAISYLRGEEFHLYPDFPTGGSIDVSKYNDGQRGGTLKVRAKIEKVDNKTLAIREIPFSKNTGTLIDSILKAVEKGKIKARKVEDNTAAEAEILVHLAPGVSSDKTLDALYAFSDCEISISPNCCVIQDNKPQFLTVSDVLKASVENTKNLLRKELEIRKQELEEQLFFASLEQIFIEERIYKGKPFENATSTDQLCNYIDERLTPFYPQFIREVRKEDILRLLEIKMQRIAKFSKDKNEELIARIQAEIADINKDLARMTIVTIRWFEFIKNKYGDDHQRKTEIRNFETIVAQKVAEANQKLYINRQEGFIGTSLKKDEFICNCSDLDDIIIFYRDGKYKAVHVADKIFVGKQVIHVQVLKKNDKRTTYNVVYRDGRNGISYIKRFFVSNLSMNRENDITQGKPGSKILYFSANPNGEAEVIKVTLEINANVNYRTKLFLEKDFSEIAIKGRTSKGNILTKKQVNRISLKSRGHSTLGGQKVWFDPDVNRINHEGHGTFLGEFTENDYIAVMLTNGDYYLTGIDVNNHFEDNVFRIEKYDSKKVWTAVLRDADNKNQLYAKRFCLDNIKRKQNCISDNPKSELLLLTDQPFPRISVVPGGDDARRLPFEVDIEEFVAVKGYKAHGKRITAWDVERIEQLEPTRFPEEEDEENKKDNGEDNREDNDVQTAEETQKEENLDPDAGKSRQQIIDEMTGQLNLFADEDM